MEKLLKKEHISSEDYNRELWINGSGLRIAWPIFLCILSLKGKIKMDNDHDSHYPFYYFSVDSFIK